MTTPVEVKAVPTTITAPLLSATATPSSTTSVAKLPVSADDRVELRAMRATDQDEWLDHLHGVFTDPRYYFHCHILHDPHFDRDSIFVVTGIPHTLTSCMHAAQWGVWGCDDG